VEKENIALAGEIESALVGSPVGQHRVELPAAPTTDTEWILVEQGFTLAREHEVESLFAIGNGYVGSRASLAEGSALSAPATFVAGVFDTKPGAISELTSVADWTRLSAIIEGQPLRLDQGHNLEHKRILDLRQGIFWRDWRHQDQAGRIIRLRALRLASLADRHLLIQCVTITPENFSGRLFIDATLTGPVVQVRGNAALSLATDFAHQLEYDDLVKDARTVIANLTPVRREIRSRKGRWYDLRMRPYRTVDDKIDGVVITFVDITERKSMEERLQSLVKQASHPK
jgi:PAS domain-containing protein